MRVKINLHSLMISQNNSVMYQVKPLNISGDNIYDVSNGQFINGGMGKMKYVIIIIIKYLINKTHEYHTHAYIQIINN